VDEIEKLYEKYFQNIYRYSLSLCRDKATAEDIACETFLKAIKSINNFRGDCSEKAWLCQIAKNTYFSMLKKAKNVTPLDLSTEIEATDFTEKLLDKASALEIHRYLHNLEEPYKEVFSLRTFGELSFAEIAEIFGKTESWSRVTYHRSKIKLKEALLWIAK